MAGHKADAARIAREVVAGRKHGRHVRIGQHSFDTTPKRQNGSPRGMCSRFVRQVLEEAMGLAEGKLGSGNGGVMACCSAMVWTLRSAWAACVWPQSWWSCS